jgi:ComF family protein
VEKYPIFISCYMVHYIKSVSSAGGLFAMIRAVTAKNLLESALGVLFPNQCSVCGAVLERGCCICNRCTKDIEFIYSPFCSICGAPIGTDTPGLIEDTDDDGRKGQVRNIKCIQCTGYSYEFSKNESLGVYAGILRELIQLFKFGKRKGLAITFASLFSERKRGYIEQHAVLIAVPLTPRRRSERGFNQASLIAERVSKECGIEFVRRCIRRKGVSKPQSSIGGMQERISNLRDSFEVGERHKKAIEGRSVLLIDDVLTTGATASACARALKKAGAARVDLLSCARTVKSSGTGSLLLAETGR